MTVRWFLKCENNVGHRLCIDIPYFLLVIYHERPYYFLTHPIAAVELFRSNKIVGRVMAHLTDDDMELEL